MSEYEMPFLEFVTQCFDEEYEKQFTYVSKTKPEEFDKLFVDFRENFTNINLVTFFAQNILSDLSKLFNNRNSDGLTVSDQVFVSFMENFTNATLTKMKLCYGAEKAEDLYGEVCKSVSTTLQEQFSKKVPFYDERFVDSTAIKPLDIEELLLSAPMVCFYYLILVNFRNTQLYSANILFGENLSMTKKRR